MSEKNVRSEFSKILGSSYWLEMKVISLTVIKKLQDTWNLVVNDVTFVFLGGLIVYVRNNVHECALYST